MVLWYCMALYWRGFGSKIKKSIKSVMISEKKMPKIFSTIVLKYQFLERDGGLWQIVRKYLSEYICLDF